MSAVIQIMANERQGLEHDEHQIEDIYLESDRAGSTLEIPSVKRQIDITLDQFSRLKGFHFEFGLTNDRHLRVVRFETLRRYVTYDVPLSIVDPSPRREISVRWGWWFGLFALSEAALLFALVYTGYLWELPLAWSLLAIVATTMLLSGLAFLFCVRDRLVFRSRQGRIPLFEIASRLPNKNAVQMFIADMRDRAREAERKLPHIAERRLATELREHRQLHEQGVLSEAGYAKAKRRLLALHASHQGLAQAPPPD